MCVCIHIYAYAHYLDGRHGGRVVHHDHDAADQSVLVMLRRETGNGWVSHHVDGKGTVDVVGVVK